MRCRPCPHGDSTKNAYIEAWKRSFDYTGRSSRPDYWLFELVNIIVIVVLAVIAGKVEAIQPLVTLYTVAQIVPHLPVTVRRLRDAGKEWPWIFIGLVPVIGGIWLIVLLVMPTVAG
ncbi:DUF805 domain-containing protein [Vulcanococcus limneticus]|uniref:DUF805 domain-containing protein n=1 Tax=Vulcanococcus limneticus TaxID=2170428 RepID=UPI00398C136B